MSPAKQPVATALAQPQQKLGHGKKPEDGRSIPDEEKVQLPGEEKAAGRGIKKSKDGQGIPDTEHRPHHDDAPEEVGEQHMQRGERRQWCNLAQQPVNDRERPRRGECRGCDKVVDRTGAHQAPIVR